jgi:hypothetical protein
LGFGGRFFIVNFQPRWSVFILQNTIGVIRCFAIYLEIPKNIDTTDQLNDAAISTPRYYEEFLDWLKTSAKSHKKSPRDYLTRMRSDVLDEVSRLVEQLEQRASRA